jgi:hypothetical protein
LPLQVAPAGRPLKAIPGACRLSGNGKPQHAKSHRHRQYYGRSNTIHGIVLCLHLPISF